MQTVINSGGYLCMTILAFKRRDLGITCKSYNYVDVDPKYPHPTRTTHAGINTPSSPSRNRLVPDYYIKP